MTDQDRKDAAFIGYHAEVTEMLKRLTEHCVENHMDADPDNISWTDVAETNRIMHELKTITDSVFNEGEHA